MIHVNESESKVTPAKKNITVKNVAIRNNCLVDIETGENDVLEQIAREIPDGIESISFKLSFELGEDI